MENLPAKLVVVVDNNAEGWDGKGKRKDLVEALLDSLCDVTIARVGFARIW